MTDNSGWQQALWQTWQTLSGWELIAMLLAIAYLLLAMKESLWCWYAAFVSTAIYMVLFWDVSLLMDSGLQVYYLGMAVFGWYQWRAGGDTGEGLQISSWGLHQHLLALAAVVVASLISGYLLSENTRAAWPYLDSFTTWGSIITTWMVTRKILENWLYWLLIDAVAILLYIDRGMYLTALLFMIYLVICVFGYLNWLKQWRQEQALVPAHG